MSDLDRVVGGLVPFLVKAVWEMRSKNIVHFDLNPANIFIGGDGHFWKVTGFDHAEYLTPGDTTSFSPRGTLGYTDPDVLNNGSGTDSSDLYFVGAILYTLVTGEIYIHDKPLIVGLEDLSDTKYGALGEFIQTLLKKNSKLLKSFMTKQRIS